MGPGMARFQYVLSCLIVPSVFAVGRNFRLCALVRV